jgi:hypothetical protein
MPDNELWSLGDSFNRLSEEEQRRDEARRDREQQRIEDARREDQRRAEDQQQEERRPEEQWTTTPSLPTQYDCLPDGDITLTDLPKLKGRENFEEWYQTMKLKLDIHELKPLLNPKYTRPPKDHEKYKRWRKCSHHARIWMQASLSSELAIEMEMNRHEAEYADDFIRYLYIAVNGDGHKLAYHAFRDALDCKRENYGSVSEFVMALKSKLEYSALVHMPLTPYQGLVFLFKGINKEIEGYVQAKLITMPKTAIKYITQKEFLDICKEVLDFLKTKLGIASPAVLGGKKPGESRRTPVGKKRGTPPQGMNHQEWVKQCLAKALPDGSCSHCGNPYYKEPKCFYIVPYLRPDTWKPAPDVWVYLPGKTRKDFPRSNNNNNSSSTTTGNTTITKPKEEAAPGKVSAVISENQDPRDNLNDFNLAGPTIPIPVYSAVSFKNRWLVDTGSGKAICTDRDLINNLVVQDLPHERYQAVSGEMVTPEGYGTTTICFKSPSGTMHRYVLPVLWSPRSPCNVLLAERMKKTLGIWYDSKTLRLRDFKTDEAIGTAEILSDVPWAVIADPQDDSNNEEPFVFASIPLNIWHRRLGHVSFTQMQKNRAVLDLDEHDNNNQDNHSIKNCAVCRKSKAKRRVSRQPMARASRPLQIIHINTEPLQPKGVYSYEHVLIIMDDFLRCIFF